MAGWPSLSYPCLSPSDHLSPPLTHAPSIPAQGLEPRQPVWLRLAGEPCPPVVACGWVRAHLQTPECLDQALPSPCTKRGGAQPPQVPRRKVSCGQGRLRPSLHPALGSASGAHAWSQDERAPPAPSARLFSSKPSSMPSLQRLLTSFTTQPAATQSHCPNPPGLRNRGLREPVPQSKVDDPRKSGLLRLAEEGAHRTCHPLPACTTPLPPPKLSHRGERTAALVL